MMLGDCINSIMLFDWDGTDVYPASYIHFAFPILLLPLLLFSVRYSGDQGFHIAKAACAIFRAPSLVLLPEERVGINICVAIPKNPTHLQ